MESIFIAFSCSKDVSEEYSTSGKQTGLSLTLCAHRNAKNRRGPGTDFGTSGVLETFSYKLLYGF